MSKDEKSLRTFTGEMYDSISPVKRTYSHVKEEEEDSKEYHLHLDDGHGGHNEDPHSTYLAASVHIINTIMGAGILSLPGVFRYLGLVLGIIFVLFLACATIYSVYMLLKCRDITNKK